MNDDLEDLAGDLEEGAEALLVDLLEEGVEVDSVLGVVLHVGRDHRKRALKDRSENVRYLY